MNIAKVLQQKRSKVSAEVLAVEHYHILNRAMRNVLSTELAELTMAQLIDGLPLAATGCDTRGTLLLRGHPLILHENLCDGVLEQTRAFRDSFDLAMLSFDSSVMQAYQDSDVGSAQFKMRLIELVAVAIHRIAVLLFNLQPKLHNGDIDSVVSWKKEPEEDVLEGGRRRVLEEPQFEPRPTLFFHIDYMNYDQYPDGLADVAGYWAEDRIFGGIILFDRGKSGLECEDIYFHSGRIRTTFRVWRLLGSQLSGLTDFLMSDSPSSSPLPILASDENLHRYDPWDAIARHHIFRDPWERKIPAVKPEETRDVRSTGDYPELETMFTDVEQAYQSRPWRDMDFSSSTWPDRIADFTYSPGHGQVGVGGQVPSAGTGDENFPLIVTNPPRSPALSVNGDGDDVSSLYVRTPPRSPVLSVQGYDSSAIAEQYTPHDLSPIGLTTKVVDSSGSEVRENSPSSGKMTEAEGKKRKRSDSHGDTEKSGAHQEDEPEHRGG